MKISADTLVELDEAIDAHKENGWVLVDRVRTPEGNYHATLKRADKNENQQELKFK